MRIRVNNSEFWVPAAWNVLVTETETYQLDTVSVQSCATIKHLAFAFVADELKLRTLDITVLDYAEKLSLVHPMVNKGTALVHPVGPATSFGPTKHLSIVVGPHDLHKYLANKVVGDLFE